MSNKRTSHSPEFKSKIAILALGETVTISELSGKYGVHSTQIAKRKKELQERGSELFERGNKKDTRLSEKEQELEKTYKQLGKLTVENDWLKKKIGASCHLALDNRGYNFDRNKYR